MVNTRISFVRQSNPFRNPLHPICLEFNSIQLLSIMSGQKVSPQSCIKSDHLSHLAPVDWIWQGIATPHPTSPIKEGESGARAVQSEARSLTCFSCFSCVFTCMLLPFGGQKIHGMPFAVQMWCEFSKQKCQLMDYWQKRKVCSMTSA